MEATKEQLTVSLNGERIVTLREGNALLIGWTYESLSRHDVRRAQDFIHGVAAGLNHVVLTGVLPAVATP